MSNTESDTWDDENQSIFAGKTTRSKFTDEDQLDGHDTYSKINNRKRSTNFKTLAKTAVFGSRLSSNDKFLDDEDQLDSHDTYSKINDRDKTLHFKTLAKTAVIGSRLSPNGKVFDDDDDDQLDADNTFSKINDQEKTLHFKTLAKTAVIGSRLSSNGKFLDDEDQLDVDDTFSKINDQEKTLHFKTLAKTAVIGSRISPSLNQQPSHIPLETTSEDSLSHSSDSEYSTSVDSNEDIDPMKRLPRDKDGRVIQTPFDESHDQSYLVGAKYYKSYPLYPTLSNERYYEWYNDLSRLKNPRGARKYSRPGRSKSLDNVFHDNNQKSDKRHGHLHGYIPNSTKNVLATKPVRPNDNTRDYVFENARSVILMPSKKPVLRYVDDRKGTVHLLEPSGLVRKYVMREDFGKVPWYLMDRNEELGRRRTPDLDKFYRPHRCKFLHGHIHCKICMRAHPTIKHRRIDWHCEMTCDDWQAPLEYRKSRKSLKASGSTNKNSTYSNDSKVIIVNKMIFDDDTNSSFDFKESLRSKHKKPNSSRGFLSDKSKSIRTIYPPVYV